MRGQSNDIRRVMALFLFSRSGQELKLTPTGQIRAKNFLQAVEACKADPAKQARLQEALLFLDRVRADFAAFHHVRRETKGFEEAPEVEGNSPATSQEAYARTVYWVRRNAAKLNCPALLPKAKAGHAASA